MKKFSELFRLNLQDLVKGLIVAVGGAVFAFIQSAITNGSLFPIDWTNMWHIALGAGLAYLGKQFFTPVPTSVEIDPAKTTVVNKIS